MNYWRMAFRWGSQGYELWDACRAKRIAAIGYYDANMRPIVGDCSKMPESEFDEAWRRGWPENTTARVSLRRFVYEMKPGDIIYAKEGPRLVGKGRVVSNYRYDSSIMQDPEHPHDHYRVVEWDAAFKPVPLKLGAEQWTVLPLDDRRLRMIGSPERAAISEWKAAEAREGEVSRSEVLFRKRNSALIEAKKAQSDYRCEACGMTFVKVYGDIGREHIVAHHLKPIGGRKRASVTRLDDIALVCSNCHDMLHRHGQLLSVAELRRRMSSARAQRSGAATGDS